jgi:hypothetical protein
VVFCSSTIRCDFVGFSPQGAGVDLYSCAPGVRRVVLDTPGNGHRGVGEIWGLSQQ